MKKVKKTKVCVCAKCWLEAECASNDWCLYDGNNKKCPNYKAGMKQEKEFEKQFREDSSIGPLSCDFDFEDF